MRVIRLLARAASALVLIAALIAMTIIAEQHPVAEPAALAGEATPVDAGPLALACPGAVQLTTGEQIAIDPETDAAPELLVPTTRTELLTLPRALESPAADADYRIDGDVAQGLARTGEVRLIEFDDPDSGGILEAQPVDGGAPVVAGASVTLTEAGDLRGLAGVSCQRPDSASYLVGGSGDVGASTRLTLTNTGATPTTASVTMWSSLGEVAAPQLEEIALAPGAQEHLLLEAISSQPDLALRVESPGGQVSAYAQELRLDGIVPAGADFFGAAAAPAQDFVIPGVVLSAADEEAADEEPAAGDAPDPEEAEPAEQVPARLRLVNPGETEARAVIRMLGEDGPVDLPGAEDVTIDPGAVLELSLVGVAPGAYGVHVSADEPLTGAVQLARSGQPGPLDPSTAPVDRAWAPAVAPGSGVIPLSPLAEAAVLFSNNSPEVAEVTVTTVADDGSIEAAERREIAPWSTQVIEPQGRALHVETDGAISASAVLRTEITDGELLTVLTPVADAAEDLAVRVRVR